MKFYSLRKQEMTIFVEPFGFEHVVAVGEHVVLEIVDTGAVATRHDELVELGHDESSLTIWLGPNASARLQDATGRVIGRF